MKKFLVLMCFVFLLSVCFLNACSKTYICNECGNTTTKAYYDDKNDPNRVMCEDCARKWWIPFDYRIYRVK